MRKTVYIKLKKYDKLDPNRQQLHTVYAVESLRNAAQVSVGSRYFRVGDYVTPEQADALCEIQFYDVTINH